MSKPLAIAEDTQMLEAKSGNGGNPALAFPMPSRLSEIFTNGALRNTSPTNASAARRVALKKQARAW